MTYVTVVKEVTYPDETIGTCYALVGPSGSAMAITVKRAIELQEDGISFAQPHPVYPGDFAEWFPPDFQQLGRGQ